MSPRTKIEKLEELVKEKIIGDIVEQSVDLLVPPGENFGSVLYKVDLKVRNNGKVETYHAVAKCTPPNEVSQELFNIQVTTKAEIAWYTTVIPTIKQFQQEHGIVPVADFFQNFYGARISLDPNSDIVDMDGVILTENLNLLGYKNIDRHIGFDLKTSKAILKNLATLHAVPIAIKNKNKELFDKNIRPHLPSYEIKEDPSAKTEDPFKDIKSSLKEIPEVTPFIDRVVENLQINKLCSKATIPKEPWASVCHNDFWINNIMVKKEDIPKIVFLDFQISAYESIAIDVLFFLVVSVSLEVVRESMDELIAYYWDELLKNLKTLDSDSPLFTFEGFLKELDSAASSGQFGHAFFHNYIMLMDKGYAHIDSSDKDFKKEDFQKNKFSLNSRHKEKYKWFILEFIKRRWI